jgi:Cu+-exporting ATPase
MTVNPTAAPASTTYGGKTYYFCCPSCLQKFQTDPGKYLAPTTPPSGQAPSGTVYTCPMDPEIRQDHPGACPKCGMALELVGGAAPATKVEYSCPMHPEVVSDHPGACPKCGMALELRS